MPVDLTKFPKKAPLQGPPPGGVQAQIRAAQQPAANTLGPRGFLKGYNGTDKFEYGNYFQLGTYGVRVKKCVHIERSNNKGVPLYIVECEIVRVLDKKEGLDRTAYKNRDGSMPLNASSNEEGTDASIVQSLKDAKIAAPSLSALAQAIGNPQSQEERQTIIDNFEEMLERACGPDQPLAGDTFIVDSCPHQKRDKDWMARLVFKPWVPEAED